MTTIQTFGPREVYEDDTTALARGRVIARYEYYAEAVGTDGRMYYATGRGRPTPLVEVQEHLREVTGQTLERRMREEGVWAD